MSTPITPASDALVTACKDAFWRQLTARGVAKTDLPRLCGDAVRALLREAVQHEDFADFYARTREVTHGE